MMATENENISCKQFRVDKIVVQSISAHKGAIDYYLTDSDSIQRKVTAIATLGRLRKVQSVKPVYHREAPLVEALSRAIEGDEINVDFADFNRRFPRPEGRQHRADPVKHDRSLEDAMYREFHADMTYQTRLKHWLPDFSAIGMLLLFLFIVWMVYMTYTGLMASIFH